MESGALTGDGSLKQSSDRSGNVDDMQDVEDLHIGCMHVGNEPERKVQYGFIELFAGEGRLTRAVRHAGCFARNPVEV